MRDGDVEFAGDKGREAGPEDGREDAPEDLGDRGRVTPADRLETRFKDVRGDVVTYRNKYFYNSS